ncbi:DUF4197 domain-containing protein [Fulvivirgaceae bacterium BMA10]|uniref:DUF4197 domain-containing protein n=1 Tax=Splendidivirga corallicola TaxID=3051826 RepID=A0ABT8KGM1_9BACT|nr:DUF4197 domain-containing protein [Fulvivirgaceae bacterium BMA10]
MKKIPSILILVVFINLSCTQQQFSQSLGDLLGGGEPTTEEVGSGLKEALIQGITKGSDKASALDGYFKNPKIKIPFPPETQKVANTLRDIGLGAQVDEFVMTLNRGAEEAAKEAKPVFVSAIKSMTIEDAWNILRGDNDAATQYLKRTTSTQLREKFQPIVHSALEKVSATKHYSDLVSRYNKIPFVKKADPDLDSYATEKAIDGLFVLIAEEELKIRKDPVARTTALLKKVFSQID